MNMPNANSRIFWIMEHQHLQEIYHEIDSRRLADQVSYIPAASMRLQAPKFNLVRQFRRFSKRFALSLHPFPGNPPPLADAKKNASWQ